MTDIILSKICFLIILFGKIQIMSETKDSGDGMPILDKIMGAGETLGVSRREIADEMKRLQSEDDIAGMQSLFKAYKNWEVRGRKPTVSVENAEELAARNFEVVAKVADAQSETDEDLLAMAKAVKRGNRGGEDIKFLQESSWI